MEAINLDRLNPAEDHRGRFQMFPVGRGGRGVAEGHGESLLLAKEGDLTSHPKSLESLGSLENHVKIFSPVVVDGGLVGSLVEGCPSGIQVRGTDAFVVGFHQTKTPRMNLSLVKMGKILKVVDNVGRSRLDLVGPVGSHVLLGHRDLFLRGNRISLNQQESHLVLAIIDSEIFLFRDNPQTHLRLTREVAEGVSWVSNRHRKNHLVNPPAAMALLFRPELGQVCLVEDKECLGVTTSGTRHGKAHRVEIFKASFHVCRSHLASRRQGSAPLEIQKRGSVQWVSHHPSRMQGIGSHQTNRNRTKQDKSRTSLITKHSFCIQRRWNPAAFWPRVYFCLTKLCRWL